jgi:hypothetical protein
MAAADPGVELVHLAGEAVRRQPFGDGVGVEEGAVDALGWGVQDAVEADGVVVGLGAFSCREEKPSPIRTNGRGGNRQPAAAIAARAA